MEFAKRPREVSRGSRQSPLKVHVGADAVDVRVETVEHMTERKGCNRKREWSTMRMMCEIWS